MNSEKIYQVTTEGDCEGRTAKVLGYVSGKEDDIHSFFRDQQVYGITLKEINVSHIGPEEVKMKNELLQEKLQLEMRLQQLNSQLNKKS